MRIDSGRAAGTIITPDTVTASGKGEVLAAPDTAEMTFGAAFADPDAKTALDRAGASAAEISSAIKEVGVAEEDIQTTNVNVFPEYANPREGETPKITGYRASVDLRAKIRDISIVGDVIEAATGTGATAVSGPRFTLDDDDDATTEAIADAMADARMRAEAMATAGERGIGGVVSIKETSIEVPEIWSSPLLRGQADFALDEAIEPGELGIKADVTVVFRLE